MQRLPCIGAAAPNVDFHVVTVPGKHPHVESLYEDGRTKTTPLRNMSMKEVEATVEHVLQSRSGKASVFSKPSFSQVPAVQGALRGHLVFGLRCVGVNVKVCHGFL